MSRGIEGCLKKSPYLVLPSASRASLASLGTASPLTSFGKASRDFIPRCVRAAGPLGLRLGATKKGLGATKKGLGATKRARDGDTWGLAQIFKTTSG
jgi:hypothetical protein